MVRVLRSIILLVSVSLSNSIHAQKANSSLSLSFGNAPWDFKVGWFDIDTESLDDHDVVQTAFSVGGKYQYVVAENVSFRFRASYLAIDLHEFRSTRGIIDDNRTKQNKFQFAPGVSFSLAQKNFSLYGGFELPLYIHGQVTSDYSRVLFAPFPSDSLRQVTTIPSGFSTGVAPFTGFNYNFARFFFCEAEFSVMCLYGKMGGTTTTRHQGNPEAGHTEDSLKGTFFEPRISIGAGIRW